MTWHHNHITHAKISAHHARAETRVLSRASKAVPRRVAHAGGNANNDDQAGFAALNANNSSANRNTTVGAHLTLKYCAPLMPCLLAKHITNKNGAGSLFGERSSFKANMKRYGNLYPMIHDPDNITLAFHNASKGKSHYRGVKMVKKNRQYYLERIREILVDKSFKNAPYHRFIRSESGKRREIFKLPFYPDRIIHHAICQVLEPIWMRQYIRDTFSCIPGRGIHDCARRVKKALRFDPQGTRYCLKFDVRKFYPSVDNDIIKQVIRRKIKCGDTLWLLDEIIDSTKGLPIGNYMSQHLSNLYLSGCDHFAKEKLSAAYYYRYCDDIVILSGEKQGLHKILADLRKYLAGQLNLSVKANYQLFPVASRGIDFVGYRFYHTHTLLRKGIAARFKKKALQISKRTGKNRIDYRQPSIASYYGWLKHGDCHNLKCKYLVTQ